jgi:hypothetical protein
MLGLGLEAENATARFHHRTWDCGYVVLRGAGAATGKDEADRFRSLGRQRQPNKCER